MEYSEKNVIEARIVGKWCRGEKCFLNGSYHAEKIRADLHVHAGVFMIASRLHVQKLTDSSGGLPLRISSHT